MVAVKVALFAAILALWPLNVLADQAMTFRAGGDFTHYKNETAIYTLGLEDFNRDGFGVKGEVGAWTDIGEGRRSSPYVAGKVAKRFGDYQGVNFTGFFGVSIVGYPDSALSSPFEFTEELILGYKFVGCGYTHFSNAGLSKPNIGRDYQSCTVVFTF